MKFEEVLPAMREGQVVKDHAGRKWRVYLGAIQLHTGGDAFRESWTPTDISPPIMREWQIVEEPQVYWRRPVKRADNWDTDASWYSSKELFMATYGRYTLGPWESRTFEEVEGG